MYDIRGVKIKEGDVVFHNGLLLKVKTITTNVIVGGSIKPNSNVIPGQIVCEAKFDVDSSKPIPVYVLAERDDEKNSKTNN